MSVTLLALIRRPEGGDAELETFLQRYHAEHLPLMAMVPGLRSTHVERVTRAYGQTDLCVVTTMLFDDQASLDVAMGTQEMRAAGKNIRDIAPESMTLLELADDPMHQPEREDLACAGLGM